MKFLLYALSFIFLDAIVPRSCRSDQHPYPYLEDPIELIRDEMTSIELRYSDIESGNNFWSISADQDSAFLRIINSDTSICVRRRSLSPELFKQLKDSIETCNLECKYSDDWLNSDSSEITLIWMYDSLTCYFNGTYEQVDSLEQYDFYGNIPALRSFFTSLFPDDFDGDTYITRQ